MERESFESERVADVLNAGFVSIKVDRGEQQSLQARSASHTPSSKAVRSQRSAQTWTKCMCGPRPAAPAAAVHGREEGSCADDVHTSHARGRRLAHECVPHAPAAAFLWWCTALLLH